MRIQLFHSCTPPIITRNAQKQHVADLEGAIPLIDFGGKVLIVNVVMSSLSRGGGTANL